MRSVPIVTDLLPEILDYRHVRKRALQPFLGGFQL